MNFLQFHQQTCIKERIIKFNINIKLHHPNHYLNTNFHINPSPINMVTPTWSYMVQYFIVIILRQYTRIHISVHTIPPWKFVIFSNFFIQILSIDSCCDWNITGWFTFGLWYHKAFFTGFQNSSCLAQIFLHFISFRIKILTALFVP